MQAEGSILVDNSVPFGEDKYRCNCELRKEGPNGLFHGGSEAERSHFLEQGHNRVDAFSHVGQELAVIAEPTK